jgi:transposase
VVASVVVRWENRFERPVLDLLELLPPDLRNNLAEAVADAESRIEEYVRVPRRSQQTPTEALKVRGLAAYLTEHPMVGAVYHQLQRLMLLLRNKHQTAKECRWHIRHYFKIVNELRAAPMPVMHALANTLWSWRDEIARMWRFTKSNAITEGLHNKMEVISRRAYGFRNFQNYRLRVRALCG